MMRPVIVEGPDGAGKSTLVPKLAVSLGRPHLHTGGENKTLEEIDRKCREQAAQMLAGNVLDRCTFISDPIYKDALGRPLLRPAAILNARLWMLDPIIVYCRTGDVLMLQSITETKKAHKPPEYLAEVKRTHPFIVRGYDREMELLQSEGFTILKYDWTRDDFATLVQEIASICVD